MYIINLFTDGFPSGQRGQTVNLLAMPSKVRILLHPLLLQSIFALEFFCHTPKRFESFSIHYILNSQVKIPGSFLYGFSLFKMSTQRVGILNYNPPASRNIINLRLDITHLYYPAKNSFQKGRLKRREIFTELLLYTLTT